jgi:hypothetical protein
MRGAAVVLVVMLACQPEENTLLRVHVGRLLRTSVEQMSVKQASVWEEKTKPWAEENVFLCEDAVHLPPPNRHG